MPLLDRPTRYLGFTGPGCEEDVDTVFGYLPPDFKHLVMVGVLAGKPNSLPNRYPAKEFWKGLFKPRPNVLSLFHMQPSEPHKLLEEASELQEFVGDTGGGFQFNKLAWPDLGALVAYKLRFGADKTIVVQLNKEAFAAVGNNIKALAARVADYGPAIDRAIVDLSGGSGDDLNIALALECLAAISEAAPRVGLVIAGGIHAGNAERTRSIHARYYTSTDIETGGRRPEDDAFDPWRTAQYLIKMGALCDECSAA